MLIAGMLIVTAAQSASAAKPAAPKAPAAKKAAAPKADAIVDSLFKKTAELKTYKFFFDYFVPKTDKVKGESRTCDFWYSGPGYLRLVVTDGDDKGSQVVYNEEKNDKAVKAKQSYMPIAISVKKNDPRLEGFFVSDWNSDVKEIKKFTSGAKPILAGEEKIKDRVGYKVVFDGLKGEFDKVIIWIDKKDSVLLQYEYYLGGPLKQRKTWYNYDLNPAITNADFKI